MNQVKKWMPMIIIYYAVVALFVFLEFQSIFQVKNILGIGFLCINAVFIFTYAAIPGRRYVSTDQISHKSRNGKKGKFISPFWFIFAMIPLGIGYLLLM